MVWLACHTILYSAPLTRSIRYFLRFILDTFAFIQLIKFINTHNKFTLNTAAQAHVYPKCTPMAAMLLELKNSTGSRSSHANEKGWTSNDGRRF